MAVISLTIENSEDEIVDGIPRSISLSTNMPATIFYTLDGSDPTTMSTMYVGPIVINTAPLSLTLKTFATNGTDTSPILIETYISNNDDQRKPHASVSNQQTISGIYPFGNRNVSQTAQYGHDAGITISSPANQENSGGFDGDGYVNAFSDETFTKENYDIKYSEWYNSNPVSGVGTLPGKVVIEIEPEPPESTEMYSNTFDPKALVIYQDFEDFTPDDSPSINRMFFSLDNSDHDDDGNKLYSTAFEGGTNLTATFIKSHYNSRKNTITYYYRDARSNKWIISTQPYQQIGTWTNSLANVVLSKKKGAGFVFEWGYPIRRTLF